LRQAVGRNGLAVESPGKSDEDSRSASRGRLEEEDSSYKFDALSHEHEPEMVMLNNRAGIEPYAVIFDT